MRRLILIFTLIVALSMLSADAGIIQSLENADNLSVGDRFIFNIRANYSLNQVEIPDTLTNFKVIDSQRVTDANMPAWFRLTIVPLLPGYHSFPALRTFPVSPRDPVADTDRFRVNIIPVRAEADSTLVDIKAPLAYRFQIPGWVYLLLAGLLLPLGILYLSLRAKKKKDAPQPAVQEPAPLPYWRQMLDKLDELIARELMLEGMVVQHHFLLAEILRSFLEHEYRMPALEMTSSEIRQFMQRIQVLHSAQVNEFLWFCDRAKFAKHVPGMEETQEMERWLRNYLLSFELIEARRILNKPRGEADAQLC